MFITERLDAKDLPKYPRFEARRFEVYISDNSISPNLRAKKEQNYEDRIKELYEKSKSNAENQELEVIDSKVKFMSYKDLQDFYASQNIKFKPYEKTLYKSEKDFDMIRINKLKMLTSLIVLGVVCLYSLISGLVLTMAQSAILNHPLTFLVLPLICLIVFVINFSIYHKSPQKRVAYDINNFKFSTSSFILNIILLPLIFAINLLLGFTFAKIRVYCITLLYPCILAFIYLIIFVAQKILSKWKKLY